VASLFVDIGKHRGMTTAQVVTLGFRGGVHEMFGLLGRYTALSAG